MRTGGLICLSICLLAGLAAPQEVQLVAPVTGATIPGRSVEVRWTLRGSHPDLRLRVALDAGPWQELPAQSGQLSLPEVPHGGHAVAIWLVHPWGEAVRRPGARALVRFRVGDPTAALPPLPLIFMNEPTSPVTGPAARALLVDAIPFGTTVGPIHRLRLTAGPCQVILQRWRPEWVHGLSPGRHRLSIELLDDAGEPLSGPMQGWQGEVLLEPRALERAGPPAPHPAPTVRIRQPGPGSVHREAPTELVLEALHLPATGVVDVLVNGERYRTLGGRQRTVSLPPLEAGLHRIDAVARHRDGASYPNEEAAHAIRLRVGAGERPGAANGFVLLAPHGSYRGGAGRAVPVDLRAGTDDRLELRLDGHPLWVDAHRLSLLDLADGDHRLEVRQLSPEGTIVSRLERPFRVERRVGPRSPELLPPGLRLQLDTPTEGTRLEPGEPVQIAARLVRVPFPDETAPLGLPVLQPQGVGQQSLQARLLIMVDGVPVGEPRPLEEGATLPASLLGTGSHHLTVALAGPDGARWQGADGQVSRTIHTGTATPAAQPLPEVVSPRGGGDAHRPLDVIFPTGVGPHPEGLILTLDGVEYRLARPTAWLRDLAPGVHELTVRAADSAGHPLPGWGVARRQFLVRQKGEPIPAPTNPLDAAVHLRAPPDRSVWTPERGEGVQAELLNSPAGSQLVLLVDGVLAGEGKGPETTFSLPPLLPPGWHRLSVLGCFPSGEAWSHPEGMAEILVRVPGPDENPAPEAPDAWPLWWQWPRPDASVMLGDPVPVRVVMRWPRLLNRGGTLQLRVDGRPVRLPADGRWLLDELAPGVHQLEVRLQDELGQDVLRTPVRTINVRPQ